VGTVERLIRWDGREVVKLQSLGVSCVTHESERQGRGGRLRDRLFEGRGG